MKNYKMIPKVTLWVLMGLGILFSVLFYVGGSEGSLEVAGDFLDIPYFTNLFLTWNYILVVLVVLITLGVVVWEFTKTYKVDKKKAMNGLYVVLGAVVLVLVCWFLGSPEELKIIGYEGTDNVGGMAQLTDACIYLTYILVLATLVAMVWGIIYTKKLSK
ncbi:MAG: hypothetical protein MJZ55_02030 [Paludibacteraceae bacterium]|nr:hypothetical protein [Bacteroidales bacterium]MCQ2330749.1 hypothetical protein [Paludibacteraceae bacterium]